MLSWVKNRSFAKAQDDIYKSKASLCHSEERSDEESQAEPLPSRGLIATVNGWFDKIWNLK